jgi:hypothetical protein
VREEVFVFVSIFFKKTTTVMFARLL